MFYSTDLLNKKGLFATPWKAAMLWSKHKNNQNNSGLKRIGKREFLMSNVKKLCESLISPVEPLAMRMSAHLMHGITIVGSYQTENLLHDTQIAITEIIRNRQLKKVNLKKDTKFDNITLRMPVADSLIFHDDDEENVDMANFNEMTETNDSKVDWARIFGVEAFSSTGNMVATDEYIALQENITMTKSEELDDDAVYIDHPPKRRKYEYKNQQFCMASEEEIYNIRNPNKKREVAETTMLTDISPLSRDRGLVLDGMDDNDPYLMIDVEESLCNKADEKEVSLNHDLVVSSTKDNNANHSILYHEDLAENNTQRPPSSNYFSKDGNENQMDASGEPVSHKLPRVLTPLAIALPDLIDLEEIPTKQNPKLIIRQQNQRGVIKDTETKLTSNEIRFNLKYSDHLTVDRFEEVRVKAMKSLAMKDSPNTLTYRSGMNKDLDSFINCIGDKHMWHMRTYRSISNYNSLSAKNMEEIDDQGHESIQNIEEVEDIEKLRAVSVPTDFNDELTHDISRRSMPWSSPGGGTSSHGRRSGAILIEDMSFGDMSRRKSDRVSFGDAGYISEIDIDVGETSAIDMYDISNLGDLDLAPATKSIPFLIDEEAIAFQKYLMANIAATGTNTITFANILNGTNQPTRAMAADAFFKLLLVCTFGTVTVSQEPMPHHSAHIFNDIIINVANP